MTFFLTRQQVRELDRRAIDEYGVPGIVLMENAGRGTAELLARLAATSDPILILCGPGNNGGDGFVIARHLQNLGRDVDVLLAGHPDHLTPDAQTNANIWRRCARLLVADPDLPLPKELQRLIEQARGWIVDALFGTGLTRGLTGLYAELAALVNTRPGPVLAVDIPSGLDCDTGRPLGPTIRATHTATFVAPKRGFAEPDAQPWIGSVHVIDIGAPRGLVDQYRQAAQAATTHPVVGPNMVAPP